jgi:hypothetical protein
LVGIGALGYLSTNVWVHVEDGDSLFVATTLQPKPMPTVEVRASRLGMVVRGDTVFYNLSAYVDSTEHDLKDILNKLPQVSVDAGGSILYKGERVSVILTEGKELFGALHKQMSEGIRADDVKSVQIIGQYKGVLGESLNTNPDNVALNVQLTDAARARLNGSISLKTDAHRFGESDATLYRTKPKIGFTLISKGNNTAQALIGPLDFLALIDPDNLTLEGIGNMEDMLPTVLFVPLGTRRNLDFLNNVNFVVQPHNNLSCNTSLYALHARRSTRVQVQRTYLEENNLFLGQKDQEAPLSFWKGQHKTEWRRGALAGTITVPVLYTDERVNIAEKGTLDGFALKNDLSQGSRVVDLEPSLKIRYSLTESNRWVFSIKFGHQSQSRHIGIRSGGPLFGLADSALVQRSGIVTNEASAFAAFEARCLGQKISISVGGERRDWNYRLRTMPTQTSDWEQLGNISETALLPIFSLHNKVKKWRYHIDFKPRIVTRNDRNRWAMPNATLPSGSIGLHYYFNQVRSFNFNMGYAKALPEFESLIRRFQVKDATNLVQEALDSNFVSERLFWSLTYSAASSENTSSISVGIKHKVQDNGILYRTVPSGNYFLNQSLLVSNLQSVNAHTRVRLRYKPWYSSVVCHAKMDHKRGYAFSEEALVPLQFSRIGIETSLYVNLKGGLQASVGFDTNRRQQAQGGSSTSRFAEQRLYGGFVFKSDAWYLKTNLAYRAQSFSEKQNGFWVCDFSADYRLKNHPIKIGIYGRNVLNLRGFDGLLPDFGPNFIGIERFEGIGGQIMLGGAYLFS